MTRPSRLVLLASLLLTLPVRAQDAQAALRSVNALDDRANVAWLYGHHTLNDTYRGPSRAESVRALAHGAALIDAADRAVVALRTLGRDEAANDLSEATGRLAETLCPDLADRARLQRATERSQLVDECSTTSDLIQAVRDFAADVTRAVSDLASESPSDCALAHRAEVTRVRSAIEQVRALIGLARSMDDPDARRETIAELRSVPSDALREARRPGSAHLVSPRLLERMFPQPLIDRYAAAIAAMNAPGADRARAAAAIGAAARALVTAPNPIDAEVAGLRRNVAALEQVLAAWRAGAPERTLARHLAAARGNEDVNDIVTDLETRLREAHGACSGS